MERVAEGESSLEAANAGPNAEGPVARSSRLPKWTLAGCLVVMLGIGAFLGGRRAGYDGGYDAGFDSAREEGLEKGRELAGLDMLRYQRFAQRSVTYPVGPLLATRLGVDATAEIDEALVEAELEKLAEEIRSEFELDSDAVSTRMTTARMEKQGFARRREFGIDADGWRHVGIAKYLASKKDYLVWKRSQAKP